MSSKRLPESEDEISDEVREYIDVLHDRIQFLTQELEEAERTVLELEQDCVTTKGDNDDIVALDLNEETAASRLVRYAGFLGGRFDEDEERVKKLLEDLTSKFDEYIDSSDDLHEVSLALLILFLKHEEMAR
jgi:hypothetical protein